MATMQQLVEGYGAVPPRRESATVPVRTVWERIGNKWPPFDPPRIPPTGLSIRWLWWHVLDDNMDPPSAEQLAAAAREEDQRFPEGEGARYRRRFPDWLEREVESAAEYCSFESWHGLEQALEGRRRLPADRQGWLRKHEAEIRPLLEDARANHRRRWPEGSPGLRGD